MCRHFEKEGSQMKRVYIILSSLFLLTSCSQQIKTPSLEELGMMGVMGFDYVDEEKMKVTVAVPQPAEGAKEKTQIHTEEGELIYEILNKTSSAVERSMSTAQLRVIIFGKEFMEKRGIEEIISELYRDATTGDNVFIAIANGTAEEMLRGDYKDKPPTSVYFNNLLQPRTSTAFISFATIHNYIFSVKGLEKDPVLPYLNKTDGTVKITNVALLKKDHFVELLSQDEGTILETIRDTTLLPDIEMKLKEDGESKEEKLVLNTVRNSSHISADIKGRRPVVKVTVSIKASIVEYIGAKDLEGYEEIQDLEKRISKQYEQKIIAFIEKLKELEVDPIGIGGVIKSKRGSKGWTEEKWREMFSNAEYKVKVEFHLNNTGSIK